MRASLARPRRLLDGAEQDFDALKAEMAADIERHGVPPVQLGMKGDPDPDWAAAYIHSTMAVPDSWERKAAHILHDCRTTLNYLIRELYIATNGKRPDRKTAQRHQFPICTYKRLFDVEIRGHRLEGIRLDLIEPIMRRQPYKQRRRKGHYALSLLSRLTDMQRHREPLIVEWIASHLRLRLLIPVNPSDRTALVDVLTYQALWDLRGPVKKGKKIARWHLNGAAVAKANVKAYAEGTIYPAFKGGMLVEQALHEIIATVRAILDEYAIALK